MEAIGAASTGEGDAAMAGPIRVFLADDHVALRTGLRLLLEGEEDIRVVGEASDGEEAIEQIAVLRSRDEVDVAVFDVAPTAEMVIVNACNDRSRPGANSMTTARNVSTPPQLARVTRKFVLLVRASP